MKKLLLLLFVFIISVPAYAKNISGDWHNDLRTLFIKNNAIIYTINIRTFNAKDINGNEIIDENEESGNFLNAIERLDDIAGMGINTLHILPINPIGKIKAFGTAGSLYAISAFNEVNPQLVSKQSAQSGVMQAKRFIKECHNRNIRVILDLPSCGSYDMFVEHLEFFVKDKDGNPTIPLDWTDVRLFDIGEANNLNEDIFKQHKNFVDFAISLGADGIRADVAGLKYPEFWSKLISYAKGKDAEFLFVAESSKAWTKPVADNAPCTPSEKLLAAGFDGYLGSYFNLKNMTIGKELTDTVLDDLKTFKKFNYTKSVLGSFTTHDEVSPLLVHGADFSKMIIWLNTTLPLNSYYIDGFPTGDTYTYQWANKVAKKSFTDDEYYFTHNGQIDIFNFSRKPGGDDYTIQEEFILANKFKNHYAHELSNAKFVPLKSSNPKLFSYARVLNNSTLIVVGNLDFNEPQQAIIKVPKIKPKMKVLNLRVQNSGLDEVLKGKIKVTLKSGGILVIGVKGLVF